MALIKKRYKVGPGELTGGKHWRDGETRRIPGLAQANPSWVRRAVPIMEVITAVPVTIVGRRGRR